MNISNIWTWTMLHLNIWTWNTHIILSLFSALWFQPSRSQVADSFGSCVASPWPFLTTQYGCEEQLLPLVRHRGTVATAATHEIAAIDTRKLLPLLLLLLRKLLLYYYTGKLLLLLLLLRKLLLSTHKNCCYRHTETAASATTATQGNCCYFDTQKLQLSAVVEKSDKMRGAIYQHCAHGARAFCVRSRHGAGPL